MLAWILDVMEVIDRLRALSIGLILSASALSACDSLPVDILPLPGESTVSPIIVTATLPPDDATATADAPTLTPTPFTALDRNVLWVGVDGRGRDVAAVWPDGTVANVPLPLNEGQQASDMVASRDGLYLAYIVWDPGGEQRGIAVWALAEANARLIARPEEGYRMVGMAFASDSSAVAYTQVENTQPVEDADWRLDMASPVGGEATTILTREGMDDAPPQVPFDWRIGSGLFIRPAVAAEGDQGIYVVAPDSGATHLLVEIDAALNNSPYLSPDGRWLAYVDYDPDHAGPPGAAGPQPNVARVVNLASGESFTMTPPAGDAVSGVRWHPDNEHLLLDVVTPAPDDPAQAAQYWALATVGEEPPWDSSSADVNRVALFDFAPYDGGVAYTLLPGSEASWSVLLLPEVTSADEPLTVSLGSIAEKFGAPVILRAP